MDAGGWAPLIEHEDLHRVLTPLWILGLSGDVIENDGPRASAAITQSINFLPDMVHMIDDYWRSTL
jgi:hypothetical protein